MFSKLFEERDKKVSLLIKLGDCLGRSLRENVTLFSIDSQNNQVTYLTESKKVISGKYDVSKDVTLTSLTIQESSVFQDGEVFDGFVNEKINSFIKGIHYGEYGEADDSFSDILSLWENRMKLDSIQNRLSEKAHKLDSIENIVESEQFSQLVEIKPQLVEFLKENFDKISTVPEIRNAINLSNAVSTAFDFPKITYASLEESESYTLKDGVSTSIYEMICRQELIKKELLESKRSFDLVWADNSTIIRLASMIFESDQSKIVGALAEALKEVPYLALASKKSLYNTFSNCLAQADGIGVKERDIQKFASDIFEVKKESKKTLINSINEKYGVNIQNLQDTASFKSLINTQIVIFEALSRLSPKASLLKSVLLEMATSLKSKSGVQGIDVNDFISEVFNDSGYGELLGETAEVCEDKIDFKRVAEEVSETNDILATLQEKEVPDEEYASDETIDPLGDKEKQKKKGEDAKYEAPEDPPVDDPEDTDTPEEEGIPELPPEPQEQKDMVGDLSDLESMIGDLADDLAGDDEDEEETEDN